VDSPELIFENATIVDGTGRPAWKGEVAVRRDRIVAVGRTLPEGFKNGAERINAAGRVLSPGFVDVHAHGELEPLADTSAAGKVVEGVTTEISGNCGLTPFPLLGALRTRFEKEARDEYGWKPYVLGWSSASEYFERLDKAGCSINRGFLAGHGSLRAAVNGYSDNPLGEDGKRLMRHLLEDSLNAGCFGLSTGLAYPPGCYATHEEIADLAKICARKGALYTSHMRSESDGLEPSINETLQICRETGARTQISHLKTALQRNWKKIEFLDKTLHQARRDGLDFHADRYPYTASSTGLDSILPNWAYIGGNAEELKRLHDNAVCAKLEAEVAAKNPEGDFWRRIQVAGVTNEALRSEISGRNMAEIAVAWNVRPFEAFRRIAIEDELRTTAIFSSMCEENLERILSWDFVMVASDATARNISGPTRVAAPHPRTFGTFPRMLAKYVRERKLMSLEDAIRRMTSLPAQTFHIADRGVIRPGAYADLVLFDAANIRDEATFTDANRFPTGIDRVYVNGVLAVRDGTVLDARAGRVLRHGQSSSACLPRVTEAA
jgi:N-acyl-D-amino-acid deacylase